MESIILGRNETDLKELGEQATIPLGRHYVTMEREKSLANSILLDINKPHVILISGKRGCLPGNHKIFTDKGYKEIKYFNEQKDKVLSFNKNEVEFIWKNANLLEYDLDNEDLIKLNLEDGREIVITNEHPLLIFHKNAVLVWCKGRDLKKGALVVTTTTLPEVKNDKESLRVARILGFTLADGNIFVQKGRWKDGRGHWYNGTKKRLRIDTDSEDVCLQAKRDIEKEFEIKAKFAWRKDCNCCRTTSRHSKVIDKLIALGVPAGKKSDIIRVPRIVWESSNRFKANFINALFSCDGHIQKNGMRIEYFTISKEFAKDLQLLLTHLGIEAKIRKKRLTGNPAYISYRLGFSDYTSILNFRTKIGFIHKQKNERLQLKKFHLVKRRKCAKYIGSDLVCTRIKDIEKINGINKVYDLQVPETHSFIANGIISHNSGKSWTLGVIAEGLAALQSELRQNISAVIFDTMGIYWTMKHPNYRDDKLLRDWQMKPTALKPRIFVPQGLVEDYEKKKLPVDFPLSVSASDLEASDWCSLFKIDFNSSAGILIERAVLSIQKKNFTIADIISKISSDERAAEEDKNLAIARFESADKWAFFSDRGINFERIFAGGELSVIDLSAYNFIEDGQEIKFLVVGLLAKKILKSRLLARKQEEVAEVGSSKIESKAPLVWMMIDEAHEFLPQEKQTLASAPLLSLLKEGRQPGISLVLATQQPGNIHETALTQSDIVLSHRLTAKPDITSLNEIMQSYLATEVQKYIDNLPKVKGAAIALDDNSEKIFPMQIAPRISWHGGGDPQAIRKAMRNTLHF